MQRFILFAPALLMGTLVLGQDPRSNRWPPAISPNVEHGMAAVDRGVSARRAAEHERREFERKANRFVELWNKLILECNSRRACNVKSARALAS